MKKIIVAILAVLVMGGAAYAEEGILPGPIGEYNLISVVPHVSFGVRFGSYQACNDARTEVIAALVKADRTKRNEGQYEYEVFCAPVKILWQPL